MKKFYLFLKFCIPLLLIFLSCRGYSQLAINTALTPAQLVQNVLVGGGVTVSNITMTGLPAMYGSFTNGATTNLGFDAGVILCTGNVTDIAQAGSAFMSLDQLQAGDANLNAISSAGTFDACVLEFDFIPLNDTIQFRYVFGSEEYPEWVNSTYNDIFAFFLTGPNPAGGNYTNQNVAIIPGTALPVSINNINNVTPSYPQYYVDNASGTTIVFDGFTTPLTALAAVIPCSTYHMKFAIADVGDGVYDSGVFLEESSFSSTGFSVTPTYSNTTLGNNAIEGCSNGIFAFTTNAPLTSPLTINYTVGGGATNGTDYVSISNSITIPTGSDSVAVVISPFIDGLTEGTETVTLTVTNVCTTMVYTIYIIDNVALALTPSGATTICPSGSATLSVTATGGITPYTYNWSGGGGAGSSATYSPANTTTYTVTVTDFCGQTEAASQTITVVNNLTITVSPTNPFICPGGNVTLNANGATSYTWSPATGLNTTTGTTVIASPLTTQTYTVTGNSSGCTGSVSVQVDVLPSLTLSVTPSAPSICPGASVTLTATSSGTGTTFTWSPATGLNITTGATVIANPTTTQTYTVNGVDGGGCTGVTTVPVDVSPITATISATTNENCGQANGSATVTAGGNCTTGFTYQWGTVPAQAATTATNLPQGNYTVSVYCGLCMVTATATITNLPGPSVSIISITNTTCSQANGGASANGSGGNSPYSYLWSNGQSGQNLVNVVAGIYNVTITDANGCQATNTVTITDSPGPNATITSISSASCGFSDGAATVTPTGGTPPYTYNWSNSSFSPTLLDVPTGLYYVTVTCSNGCTTTTSVSIGEDPGPTATAFSVNEICDQANGTATVNATGGVGNYTYLWSDGQTTSTATGLSAGSYSVTVSDGGCSTVEMANVLETPGPDAGFSASPQVLTLMDGPVSFLDNSSGNIVTWDWNFGDGTANAGGNAPDHPYENMGTFLVTLIVTDDNGCMDTTQDTIVVKEIYTFYIPNTFTPNGDGINDYWTPKGLSVDPLNFEMDIFDRWGNVMFHSKNWNSTLNQGGEPWNGTMNNDGNFNDIVMDVYVYRIKIKEVDGPKHEYIGRITLAP
ncbi:MAG: choice-of-anchor L domain-containing protein [Bacteroidota bacterium]